MYRSYDSENWLGQVEANPTLLPARAGLNVWQALETRSNTTNQLSRRASLYLGCWWTSRSEVAGVSKLRMCP